MSDGRGRGCGGCSYEGKSRGNSDSVQGQIGNASHLQANAALYEQQFCRGSDGKRRRRTRRVSATSVRRDDDSVIYGAYTSSSGTIYMGHCLVLRADNQWNSRHNGLRRPRACYLSHIFTAGDIDGLDFDSLRHGSSGDRLRSIGTALSKGTSRAGGLRNRRLGSTAAFRFYMYIYIHGGKP